MPRTEEQIQELVREMYTTAESSHWELTPETIRFQRGQRRVPLPDVKVLVLIAAAVILIVVGIVVANGPPSHRATAGEPTTTSSTFPPGTSVAVPNAIHQTLSEATPVFRNAGLQVTTTYVVNNLASGDVVSQSPTAGTLVRRGSSVSLTVSSGRSAVRVPSAIGLSQAQAANVLGENGLNVGSISTTVSTIVPAGVIVSESPTAGSLVVPGSSVDLVVSSGP